VILAGLKAKKFVKGCIRCARGSLDDCYVVLHRGEDEERVSVKVQGKLRVNRAVDGDVVALEVTTEAVDWQEAEAHAEAEATPAVRVAEETGEASVEVIEGIAPQPSLASTQLHGRVVGIIRRNWRQYAGSLVGTAAIGTGETAEAGAAAAESVLFAPVDARIPRVLIRTRRKAELSVKT